MPALRFFLTGYGIAAIAGFWTGAEFGFLAGILCAWLGGAALSLLIAWAWFHAGGNGALRTATVAAGPAHLTAVTPGGARLVKVWDRDLAGGFTPVMAGGPGRGRHARAFPGRTGHPERNRARGFS